jgi:hypothetical protein
LKNINRPGNWKESRELGLEMYRKFAESKNMRKIFVEVIVGLPGQTVDTYTETLDEIYSSGFIPRTSSFLILSNAPANYDTDYREKFKEKYGVSCKVRVTLHMNFDNFKSHKMEFGGINYKDCYIITRMVPPGPLQYFYAV